MQESPFIQKLFVIAGFFASLTALLLLLWLPHKSQGILTRPGFVAAMICASGALVFFCAALFAYVIRKRKWSPRSCRWAGLLFAVPGVILLVTNARFFSAGGLLLCMMGPTGYICRRLAFPALTDEQAFGPEPPPSLISK
jgi:hypothetical protein